MMRSGFGKSLPPAAGRFAAFIDAAASEAQIPARLIYAVIAAESNFDPSAVSPKGAIGLMQLMPDTGLRFGASNLRSLEENIRAGALCLRWLSALFDGDLQLVLAAYKQATKRRSGRTPNSALPLDAGVCASCLEVLKCLNNPGCSRS